LQHALYRAAKADPGRRFHALRDKIYRRDVLWRAWVTAYRNGGAPGIDKITLVEVEQYGVDRLLEELAGELREGRYRSLPTRRVLIPKPGTSEQRPLSIPAVVIGCVQGHPAARRSRRRPVVNSRKWKAALLAAHGSMRLSIAIHNSLTRTWRRASAS
jgi:hypothetical protein